MRAAVAVVVVSSLLPVYPLRVRRNNATEVVDEVSDVDAPGDVAVGVPLQLGPGLLHQADAPRLGNGSSSTSPVMATSPPKAGVVAPAGAAAAPEAIAAAPAAETFFQTALEVEHGSAAGPQPTPAKLLVRHLPEHWHKVLLAVGGGTGVLPANDSHVRVPWHFQKRLEFRSRSQMGAVLFLIFVGYFFALAVSLNILYVQVQNDSPVTFYADPRYHSVAMTGDNLSDFLSTFNEPPKQVFLRVTGLEPLAGDSDAFDLFAENSEITQWHGVAHRVAFTFALDVASWLVRAPAVNAGRRNTLEDGVTSEDLESIAYFMFDTNDLASLQIRKEVEWPCWDELATNIRQKIRQRGFDGVITVGLDDSEVVSVHKNKTWANFMHSRATKALAAISVVGVPPFWLYMWTRCRSTEVRTRYCVDVSPTEYWRLIGDQLSADGFSLTPELPEGVPQERGGIEGQGVA